MNQRRGKEKDPIEALAEQIRHHRQLYYNESPEVSDAEFDALEDRLRAIAPDHPVLGEVGAAPDDAEAAGEADPLPTSLAKSSPDQLAGRLLEEVERFYDPLVEPSSSTAKLYRSVWDALVKVAPEHPAIGLAVPPRGLDWPKATHEIPMGSLNKVNAHEELSAWANRCDELATKQELDQISDDLAMTEKLDGISLEAVYQDGHFAAGITRGDGLVGERISANVARMQGVPETVSIPGRISVRGEIILRKSDADRFVEFKKSVDPRFTTLKSLRNTAAGIARTKDPKLLPGCRFLTVLFYDLEGVDGLEFEADKLELLTRAGFSAPNVFFGNLEALSKIHDDYAEEKRAELDYDIDGLVVRANGLRVAAQLGELNNRPRAAVAFKFGNEFQVTMLKGILWSTGDSGRITPIAQIAPVFLAGAEVRQASLHNVAKIRAMGIGIGDEVLVSRRNDVIPYVEKVVVDSGSVEPIPTECGVCQSPISVEGEYLLCRNRDCPAVLVGRMKTWIKQLGLLDWGEKTFERLYEAGLAKEPADLYRLRRQDIASLDGYGQTSAKKLLEPLEKSKALTLDTYIAALGIESVSKETGKLLVSAGYENLAAVADATIEDLAAIDGLGTIKAERIKTGMAARMDEIERLSAVGVSVRPPVTGGALSGKSFCFSGSHSKPRKVLVGWVESHGGTVRSGVSKGLDYLVLANPDSSSTKAQKARKLGTEVIDEASLEALIG